MRRLFEADKNRCNVPNANMGCCFSTPPNAKELLLENAVLRRRLTAELDNKDPSSEELQRHFECKICFDAVVSTVFLPCGHCMACTTCGVKLRNCPLCVSVVERVTHVTFP